jgi:hypothetical protein
MARSFKDQRKHQHKAGAPCSNYTGAGKEKFTDYWSPEQYNRVKMARKSKEIK